MTTILEHCNHGSLENPACNWVARAENLLYRGLAKMLKLLGIEDYSASNFERGLTSNEMQPIALVVPVNSSEF
jgi:hypothetical protein